MGVLVDWYFRVSALYRQGQRDQRQTEGEEAGRAGQGRNWRGREPIDSAESEGPEAVQLQYGVQKKYTHRSSAATVLKYRYSTSFHASLGSLSPLGASSYCPYCASVRLRPMTGHGVSESTLFLCSCPRRWPKVPAKSPLRALNL
jgi:hypothetical protein